MHGLKIARTHGQPTTPGYEVKVGFERWTKSARHFTEHCLTAWNAHDLDAILDHFSNDVVLTSPEAAQLVAGFDGVIRGKAELRAYWAEGMRRIPDFHFDVAEIYVGVDTIVINYRNRRGSLANEVRRFERSLVVEGPGACLNDDAGRVTGAETTADVTELSFLGAQLLGSWPAEPAASPRSRRRTRERHAAGIEPVPC